MAAETLTGLSGKVAVTNIGLLLSGDIDQPILDADTLVIDDGLIVAIGKEADCDLEGARTTVDCKGHDGSTWPDRLACASGIRRLDAASESARLDRDRI